MDCSSHYSDSVDHEDRTKTKFVHVQRTSNDDHDLLGPRDKPVEQSTAPSFRRTLLSCFAFLRPRKTTRLNAEQARRQDLERRTPTPLIVPSLSFAKMKVAQVDAAPYAWPVSGGMNPKNTALVIIDMQKDCKFWLFLYLLSCVQIS